MGDLFDQVHAEAKGDIFDQLHAAQPVQQAPQGSAAGRFFGGLWENTGGAMLHMGKLAADILRAGATQTGPSDESIQALGGIVQGHVDQAQKAHQAFQRGRYTEAVGHLTAAALPLVGPAAAAAGEQIGGTEAQFDKFGNVVKPGQAPDVAGGMGAAIGQVGMAASPAIGRAIKARLPESVQVVPPLARTLNPVEQSAVDFLKSREVPVNVGTQTGNKAVKAIQSVVQNSPLGATTAAEFGRGTEAGLRRVAGELAYEAFPDAVTPESAGAIVPDALRRNIKNLELPEREGYKTAWQGRYDDRYTETVPVKTEEVPVTDEAGKPTGQTRTEQVMQPVNMPVDIQRLKEIAAPIFDEMRWRLAPAEQSSNEGFHALDLLLKSPDYIPAWQAENALGGLKAMARIDNAVSGVRNVSEGIGAHLIPTLQEGIDAAVAKTGEDAIHGLQQGRAFHATKMQVADVADQLRQEPVQNFNKMTWRNDTGIDFLRKIEEQTPDVLPQVGRALVDQIFDQATREGGFSRARTLLSQWQAIGPETKKLLYQSPRLREGLDNFFKGAEMVGQNPNPSGTELVRSASQINPLRWFAGYAGSKLLFTPRGQQILTEGFRIPLGGARAVIAERNLRQLAAEQGPPDNPTPPAGPGGSPPSTPPTAGTPAQGPNGPLKPYSGPVPDWVRSTPQQQFQQAQDAGIVPAIESLSAMRLTSRQIADRLQDQIPGNDAARAAMVRGVQQHLEIPSPDNARDFGAWLDDWAGRRAATLQPKPGMLAPPVRIGGSSPAPGPTTPAASTPSPVPPRYLGKPTDATFQAGINADAIRARNATELHPGGAGEGTPDTGAAGTGGVAGSSATRGAQTRITIPGSATVYPAQYEVRELADLQASHHGQTFSENPKYPLRNDRNYDTPENQGKIVEWSGDRFEPGNLVNNSSTATSGPPVLDSAGNVLGGNGRTMILQRVYGRTTGEGAAAYRQALQDQAHIYGLDPQVIGAMKEPVLVRVIADEHLASTPIKQRAITEFNTKETASLTPSERAIADSRRVSQDTLDHISGRLNGIGSDATLAEVLEGAAGVDVLNRLIHDGVISSQERAEYMGGGALTPEGKGRISKLMLGRFFSEPGELDNLPASVRNKMERIAAPLSQLESNPYWSLTDDIKQAMRLNEERRAYGAATIQDVLRQHGLYAEQEFSPQAVRLAEHLWSSKPTELQHAVEQYLDRSRYSEQYEGPGMFGEFPPPQKAHEAFEQLFGGKLAAKPAPPKPHAAL